MAISQMAMYEFSHFWWRFIGVLLTFIRGYPPFLSSLPRIRHPYGCRQQPESCHWHRRGHGRPEPGPAEPQKKVWETKKWWLSIEMRWGGYRHPPVIKHGNGKYMIDRWCSDWNPRFVCGFPSLPRLMTPEGIVGGDVSRKWSTVTGQEWLDVMPRKKLDVLFGVSSPVCL